MEKNFQVSDYESLIIKFEELVYLSLMSQQDFSWRLNTEQHDECNETMSKRVLDVKLFCNNSKWDNWSHETEF